MELFDFLKKTPAKNSAGDLVKLHQKFVLSQTKKCLKMFVLIFLAFSLAGIVGCETKSELEGKWKKIQNGDEHGITKLTKLANGVKEDYDWYFKDSKTVFIPVSNPTFSGWLECKYETDNGKLRILYKDTEIFFVPYSLDGNMLTISLP